MIHGRKQRIALMTVRLCICVVLTGKVAQAAPPDADPFPAQARSEARLVTQLGHGSGVRSVAYAPDGQLAATGGESGWILVWELTGGRELRRFRAHEGGVASLAFSPDGRFLLSGGDTAARLWDWRSGHEVRRFEGHKERVEAAAFSPDGRRVASGSRDGAVVLWRASDGKALRRWQSPRGVLESLAFSPDGRRVATGSALKLPEHDIVQVWDAVSGRELRRLQGEAVGSHVAFSPDGRHLATVSNGPLPPVLWDAATGELEHYFEWADEYIQPSWSVAFSPDGLRLLTGDLPPLRVTGGFQQPSPARARLWEVATGRQVKSFVAHWANILDVAFSPDGRRAITGGADSVALIWDLATGEALHTLGGASTAINAVAISPDGRYLVTGRGDAVARLWDLRLGRQVQRFEGHEANVTAVAFAPDGRHLATGSVDASVRLWEMESGREVRRYEDLDEPVTWIQFSPEGRYLVAKARFGRTIIWETSSGGYPEHEVLFRADRHLRADTPHAIAFSPDGRYALLGSWQETAVLWDLEEQQEVRRFEGHTGPIPATAFSPDGRFAMTGGEDGTARLWDVATGRELKQLQTQHAVWSVAFSPDGRRAATVASETKHGATVWDLETGEALQRLVDDFRGTEVVFSPDGRFLVSSGASSDWIDPPELWDVETGKRDKRFRGDLGWFSAAAFAPDGRHIVTGGQDGRLRIWDVRSGEELADLFGFYDGDWAVTDRDGRFDASNGGDVYGLHWVVGMEAIALGQLKERYYEPGLLAKRLGLEEEPLRDVAAFTSPRLFPGIEAEPVDPDLPVLHLALANRGGGIGRVVVLLNGKELSSDARAPATDPDAETVALTVPLAGHPYLIPGRENVVEVRAFNAEGYLSSRGIRVSWRAPGESAGELPTLWAVLAGVSDYRGERIDLRYSAKDAGDMAGAIRLGARHLFGAERVRLRLLTTGSADTAESPTKKNLRQAFDALAQAKPWDVLFIYLAGHGVTYGDEYYFLTQEARSAELVDPEVRESTSVSSAELVAWLKESPALKQVMVLDTCAAGELERKLVEQRDISADQVRAMERLKDRTGFHVLMGSAADRVSYEATRFEQGLLTYSLLQGMRGPALREGGLVDVSGLFQYAADQVPRLARNIGGIQQPRIAAPKGTSFDLGQLSEEERRAIPLATPKPLLLRPVLLNADLLYDDLGLSEKLRARLRAAADATMRGGESSSQAVYIEADELVGAIRPSGTYRVESDRISARLALVVDGKKLAEVSLEGEGHDLDALATRWVAQILESIVPPP